MEKWQHVQSIYQKLIARCPVGTLRSKLSKIAGNYPVRVFCGNIMQKDGRTNVCTRIVPVTENAALNNKFAQNIKFVNLNNKLEQKNFWMSHLTKFSQFCFLMDESTKLAPYMDDYSEPWTDERFVEFFGLTEDEWKVIDETIK